MLTSGKAFTTKTFVNVDVLLQLVNVLVILVIAIVVFPEFGIKLEAIEKLAIPAVMFKVAGIAVAILLPDKL
ncbi:hypothetical protein D3C84_1268260 [compost metagenome]